MIVGSFQAAVSRRNVILMQVLSAALSYLFFFVQERCCVIISFAALTPCVAVSALDSERKGMAQLLISSVSSSFSQPKACRAGGGGRENSNDLSSPDSFIGIGPFFFFTLA